MACHVATFSVDDKTTLASFSFSFRILNLGKTSIKKLNCTKNSEFFVEY